MDCEKCSETKSEFSQNFLSVKLSNLVSTGKQVIKILIERGLLRKSKGCLLNIFLVMLIKKNCWKIFQSLKSMLARTEGLQEAL